jgi:hypothetical protein
MQISRKIMWLGAVFAVSLLGCATYEWARSPETPAIAGDAAPTPGVIRATKFLLVDDKGNVRATLGEFDWVGPPNWTTKPTDLAKFTGLVVYGPDDLPLVQIGTDAGYSWLALRTQGGYAAFNAEKDGAGMGLFSPPGVLRYGLGMKQDGNGGFVMNDLKGRTRFAAGMPEFGAVGMGIQDESGESLWHVPHHPGE